MDEFDVMDSVETPTYEAPTLDDIESAGIEDYSLEETEILDNKVDDIMGDVEMDELTFDDEVEEPYEEISDSNELNETNEVGDWIKEINPNFDPFDWESPYNNNCGSCAYAVYKRLEGDTDIVATEENIGYNSQMEALTGMEQVSMSPEEIANRLLEQGDGAHAIIGIDRAEGPGHWFNAACIDGKVVAIDGQSGEISDWPPDYGDVVNWEMSIKK